MTPRPLPWTVPLLSASLIGFAACSSDSPTEPTPPSACSYTVLPAERAPCMAQPDTVTMTVITGGGCGWTARADDFWLAPVGPAGGSGRGSAIFSVLDNWDAPREGRIRVEDPTGAAVRTVRVAQAGCVYTLVPSELLSPWPGGTYSFQVVQHSLPASCGGPLQNACQWSATTTAPWITITTPMPRVGDDVVNVTLTGNPTGPEREGYRRGPRAERTHRSVGKALVNC